MLWELRCLDICKIRCDMCKLRIDWIIRIKMTTNGFHKISIMSSKVVCKMVPNIPVDLTHSSHATMWDWYNCKVCWAFCFHCLTPTLPSIANWHGTLEKNSLHLNKGTLCKWKTVWWHQANVDLSSKVSWVHMMTSSNGNIFHVTGHLHREFPAQRPVTRSFDIFFDLRLNKRLSKQSWGWWFEMPSHPLWGHCN